MKNITTYNPDKYSNNPLYRRIEGDIYLYDNPPDVVYSKIERLLKLKQSRGYKYKYGMMLTHELEPKMYVTSLSFEQEPHFGEGNNPTSISQYPLETILEKYGVWIQDFYTTTNSKSKKKCYQEFASRDIKDLRKLRKSIIGKHVYERPIKKDKNYVELVIE